MTGFHGIPLSVLDTAPVWQGATATDALHDTLDLAVRVDRLGYRRYWLAEHHNLPNVATSAPAIVAGQIAARTGSIRVGSGGVMLPNHAPLVVAEQFGTLEALHPGRIDLGIGRAPGTDPATARALRRDTDPLSAHEFPGQIVELLHYFGGTDADGEGRTRIAAVPAGGHRVPVWILGSSPDSARLAAHLGLPYAYAHHLNPFSTVPAMRLYRTEFRPSAQLEEPYAMVAAIGMAADSDERADWLAGPMRLAFTLGRRGRNPRYSSPEEVAEAPLSREDDALARQMLAPQLIGGPAAVAARLEALVGDTGLDELMLLTMIQDREERARSYELFSELVAVGDKAPAGLA